jgi:hypothetical protein
MWTLSLLALAAAIWLAILSAVVYACTFAPERPAAMRARGLEPPRASRPSGS